MGIFYFFAGEIWYHKLPEDKANRKMNFSRNLFYAYKIEIKEGSGNKILVGEITDRR